MIAGVSSLLGAQSAAVDEASWDHWHFAAGAGAADISRCIPAATSGATWPCPFSTFRYGRFFLGNSAGAGSTAGGGLGLNAYQDSHWRLRAVLSGDLEAPRKESKTGRSARAGRHQVGLDLLGRYSPTGSITG